MDFFLSFQCFLPPPLFFFLQNTYNDYASKSSLSYCFRGKSYDNQCYVFKKKSNVL